MHISFDFYQSEKSISYIIMCFDYLTSVFIYICYITYRYVPYTIMYIILTTAIIINIIYLNPKVKKFNIGEI